MQRRIVHFGGRVQGVGFRYTAHNMAIGYNVTGYVRNLPDGRVELVVEGQKQDIDELVENIKDRMQGFLSRVTDNDAPATGEFKGFVIRH